jgi:murein L,D-transpeptidase YcbB/YkuD
MHDSFKCTFRTIMLSLLLVAVLFPGAVKAGDEIISAAVRDLLLPAFVTEGAPAPIQPPLMRIYAERRFAPLWQSPARREQLLATLAALGDDGLNPADYQPEALLLALSADDEPAQRARQELLITEGCLLALTHLQRGRLDPQGFGHMWRAAGLGYPALPSPEEALAKLDGDDISALFDRFRPQTGLYRGLRAALAQAVRDAESGEWPQVSPGPTLKAGMASPRVIELRTRLAASGHLFAVNASGSGMVAMDATLTDGMLLDSTPIDSTPIDSTPIDATLMDPELVEAVRSFQRDHGLEVDGVVGRATLAALNQSREHRLAQLRINLERARWIAAEQQRDHVLVDIAGYRLTYFRDGTPAWSGRTQVGMPTRKTPELLSRITHLTVNPTWTVPPTILKKDIAPKASTDPDYLASRNIRVIDRDGEVLDPATVDWSHPAGLTLRQDFGEGSALGKVAIRFANPHAIYLHDTPNRRQFKRTERAFSSGCVRVENALELVRLLLTDGGDTYQTRLDNALASGRTGNLSLPRPVPIIVAYLTAGPDEEGRIAFRPDVYERDASLIEALERRAVTP